MSRLITALLVLALLAGLILWRLGSRPHPTLPPVATPARPAARVSTTAQAQATPLRFRLAGVAAAGESGYVVIEDPHGVTALYRLGENVSGLGRLAGIAQQEVLIDTDNGPVTLRLQPAPSPSPLPSVTRSARSTATAAPTRTPSPADSASE